MQRAASSSFQGGAAGEAQRAGAQAADAACRQFEHGGPGLAVVVIDAQFGVDGPAGEPERAGRLPGGGDRRGKDRAGQPGGSDEQGFLEGGAVGCGGLVEDGGDGEAAAC
jgi:hypothetical protein